MALAYAHETFDHVLRQDRQLPPEEQTTFHLRTLPWKILRKIKDREVHFSDGGTGGVAMGTREELMVRHGIAGWTNLLDREGRSVEPRIVTRGGEEVLDDASIEAISPYVSELARVIGRHNRLDEDEEGNSSSSPSS